MQGRRRLTNRVASLTGLLVAVSSLTLHTTPALAAVNATVTTNAVASLAPAFVSQGTTNVGFMTFTLSNTNAADKLKSMAIKWRGTAATPAPDLATLKLYRESGEIAGSSFSSATDTLLISVAPMLTSVTLDFADYTFAQTKLYLVGDVKATAPAGDRIDWRIDATKISFQKGTWPPAAQAATWDPAGNTLIDRAPTVTSQSVATPEDIAKLVTLSATDPDGNTSTFQIVTAPASGVLAPIALPVCVGLVPKTCTATVLYTPLLNWSGNTSFVYQATDSLGLASAGGTVNLAIGNVNDFPVAGADAASTNEDTPVTFNVLGNDVDVDGDPLTMTAFDATSVSDGAVSCLAPNCTYTPAAEFSGGDSFTYTISDGLGGTAVGTASITVAAVNDGPVAAGDGYTIDEDTALVVDDTTDPAGVLDNDLDIDGPAVTAVLVSTVTHGVLVLAPDGSFTYTPAANYNGPDAFTYKANDGSLDSAVVAVAITVNAINDLPACPPMALTTSEDSATSAAASCSDVDSGALTYSITSAPSNGTASFSGAILSYNPAANYAGADSLTFQVSDGVGIASVTVGITVTAVNDAPVGAGDSFTVAEDASLSAPSVLGNDSDVEATPLTAVLVSGVSHGAFALAANGTFTYTPVANYNGPDSFVYKASDGVLFSANVTVAIIVTAVNDLPVCGAASITTPEDTAASLATTCSDVEGTALAYAVTAAPANGSASFAGANVTYTPAANYAGADSFTFTVSDGGAPVSVTVTVSVTAVNDAPSAAADSYTVDEDGSMARTSGSGVLANDSDVDGPAMTAALVSGVSHGTLLLAPNGSFTYTPGADYHGPDTFSYKVSDGSLFSSVVTVTITVTSINDTPVCSGATVTTEEDAAVTAPASCSDVDGDALTYAVATAPAHGAVTFPGGSPHYTPDVEWSGSDAFTFVANDGTVASAPASVTVTVTPVFDAPDAVNDTVTLPYEGGTTTIDVLANDITSPDSGIAPTVVSVTAATSGTMSILGGGASLEYTPPAAFTGVDSVTYTISDGLNSDTATVSIDVAPVVTLAPPASLTAPMKALFNEDVQGVTAGNFQVSVLGSATPLAGTVSCVDAAGTATDCATGPVRSAGLTLPLIAGQMYTSTVNPAGAPAGVTDLAGRAPIPGLVSTTFRASRIEQETTVSGAQAWRPVGTSKAYGSSYVTERLSGATVSVPFTGTSVTWYTVTGKNQGWAYAYVDGTLKAKVNNYASATHYRVARTVSGLTAGAHTLKIYVRGLKGSTGGTDTLVTLDAVKDGGVINAKPAAKFAWARVSASSASGKKYARSNLAGTTYSFTFRGTAVRWYTVLGTAMGKAKVTIDGAYKGTVDTYSTTTRYNTYRKYTGLSDTVHTIRITVLGQKRAASKGTSVAVDRFYVS